MCILDVPRMYEPGIELDADCPTKPTGFSWECAIHTLASLVRHPGVLDLCIHDFDIAMLVVFRLHTIACAKCIL